MFARLRQFFRPKATKTLDTLYYQGIFALRFRGSKEAVIYFGEILRQQEKDPKAKAWLLLSAGKYNESLEYFERAEKESGSDNIIRFGKGEALMHSGMHEGALRCFSEIVTVPQPIEKKKVIDFHSQLREFITNDSHSHIGTLQMMMGKYEDALVTYNTILAKNPDQIDTMLLKATTLMRLKRTQEAELCVQKILSNEPTHQSAQILKNALK